MNANETKTNRLSKRDIAAAVLMILAAVGAGYSFISSIGVALSAGAATQQVEWWRVAGFLLFAVLFVMLAFGPRRYPGIWELVILDKAALTIVEFTLAGNGASNASFPAIADAVLVVILLAAFFLSRGYASWMRTPAAAGKTV
ncbi:hypothetical protein EG834_13750 [bacterium]|nr:hypothetical protein [bacterium]